MRPDFKSRTGAGRFGCLWAPSTTLQATRSSPLLIQRRIAGALDGGGGPPGSRMARAKRLDMEGERFAGIAALNAARRMYVLVAEQ